MPVLAELVDGVIGVDTHRDSLVAAALSSVGGVLGQTAVSADAAGYQTLLSFADVHLTGRRCCGIAG
jgi:transposase